MSRTLFSEALDYYAVTIRLLTELFSEVLDYYAPVKQKVARTNQASFRTKNLSKLWWNGKLKTSM